MSDARKILDTASTLERGRATFTWQDWTVAGDRHLAERILQAFSGGLALPVRFESEDTRAILGVSFSLGRVILTCERAYMTEQDIDALSKAITSTQPGQLIRATLRPYEGCLIEAEYPDWLS